MYRYSWCTVQLYAVRLTAGCICTYAYAYASLLVRLNQGWICTAAGSGTVLTNVTVIDGLCTLVLKAPANYNEQPFPSKPGVTLGSPNYVVQL